MFIHCLHPNGDEVINKDSGTQPVFCCRCGNTGTQIFNILRGVTISQHGPFLTHDVKKYQGVKIQEACVDPKTIDLDPKIDIVAVEATIDPIIDPIK